MAITTKDIAEKCKVSRTTVHRAFNNTGRISEETREFILKTAEEMGYKPDLLATSLKKGKTGNLGVVVFDVKNQYFAEMLNALELEAQKNGYFINISLHQKQQLQEREMLERLAGYRVEGIVLSPVSRGKEFEDFLLQLNTPIVIIGNKFGTKIPCVGIDEKKAAKEAVEMIAAKGYKKIYFVCPPLADMDKENVYSHVQRRDGFLETCQSMNISGMVIDKWDYLPEVEAAMSKEKEKIAFFCSGDVYALEIMKDLRRKKLTAGKDYGIMGFDNIDMLDYVTPRLTTIDNSINSVSSKAMEVLLAKINDEPVKAVNLIPHKIIEGETL